MASKYIQDLRSKGVATNNHGVRISTVEQSGQFAGESLSRVWWQSPHTKGASRWHYISCESAKDAFITASSLADLTYEQINEKY